MKASQTRKRKRILTSLNRKKVHAILDSERCTRIYRRALILKMVDEGHTQVEIVALRIACDRTVRNTVKKFSASGLRAALFDKERRGQPRRFSKTQEERIAAVVCSNPPDGQARWTLSLIKEYSEKEKIVDSISEESVRILLCSRDIKPWKHKMWCIPKVDEQFITRMEDVLATYERPHDPKEPVVCLDEKPIQLLESAKPEIRMRSSVRQDYEYVRQGVVNAFCAIEPKAGRHFVDIRERKTSRDFARFVKKILDAYPNARKVHLVMDNLSTHTEKALVETFGKKLGKKMWSRIHPHYTPKHGSWLNQAEIEINMFSRTCLGKIRVPDIQSLRKMAAPWRKRMNRKKVKINWAFSRRKARVKFKYKTGKN